MKTLRPFFLACLGGLFASAVWAGANQWTGNGPLATGLGNRVVSTLAVSPDGQTVYAGTGSGSVFAYAFALPTAVTDAASAIGPNGATVNGTVNANNADAAVTFEYGLTTSYGSTAAGVPSPVSGGGDTQVSAALTGLACGGVTYHFRVTATNASGVAYGADRSFATDVCPPTYRLTYDGNAQTGGTPPVDSNAYLAGATATVLGNSGGLVKAGHGFAGWNTLTGGGGAGYAPGDSLTITGAVTLYATWAADNNKPTVTAFAATSPSSSLIVPITTFAATDDYAVTGYLVTTSATPPSAAAAGWSGAPPSSFTVTGLGSHTLYPWAKDGAGNVSAVYASPANVTVCANAITVTSLADSGPGTLRQALVDVCAGGSISIGVHGVISLSSELDVTKDVVIVGPGAANLTLDGGNATRMFTIPGANVFTLRNLTLANGFGLSGGALMGAWSATIRIEACVFTGNRAQISGGAIASMGPLTIADSSFIDNSGPAQSAYGGAVFAGGTGLVTISASLFSGNSGQAGGAIALGTAARLTNLTLAGNVAGEGGGAIMLAAGGPVDIVNTTIANNSVTGATDQGGGIGVAHGVAVNLKNSLVAGNGGGDCGGGTGLLTANAYNIDGDGSCDSATTRDSTQLALDALADNGGPTRTIRLLAGSAAIDAGDANECAAVDQRGMARPQGSGCDVGAYELGGPALLTASAGTPQSTRINTAFPTALAVRLSDAAGGPVAGAVVTFIGPGSGAGILGGGSATTDAMGVASFTVAANGITGSYQVVAAAGFLTAQFSLANLPVPVRTVTGDVGSGLITASFTGGGDDCGFTAYQFTPAANLPAPLPAGVSLPHGLFAFTTSGCTPGATLEFTLDYPSAVPGGQYWKYGSTPTRSTPHWYVLPADVTGNQVRFSIQDGGLGDDDWASGANGGVRDPGGLGAAANGGWQEIPTLSTWTLALLALLLPALVGRSLRWRGEAH